MTSNNNTPIPGSAWMLVKPGVAAESLAISPRKLLSLTSSEAIRCVRIGRAVRYDVADLRAYVESLKVGAAR